MSLTHRAATVEDVGAVLAFWRVAAEDSHRPVDEEAAVRALVHRDPDALRLVLDGTAIVGSVVAGWDGWRCHLYRLAVDPLYRRRGIATDLLDWAEQRFADLGGRRADAMVLDDNALAQPTWRAAGFAPQTEWSRWVKPLGASSRT